MKDRRTLNQDGSRIERRSPADVFSERITGMVYTQLMMRLMPNGWMGPDRLLVGASVREAGES